MQKKNVKKAKPAASRATRKKPVQKKRAAAKPKAVAARPTPPTGGMWKILEMKKARERKNEQARAEGHSPHGPQNVLQPFSRNTRFMKFAGPRRRAG